MVEAILLLAPDDFTRPEAAQEAGLHKPSANRILAALEKDGVIEVVGRRPIRYGVRSRITLLEILSLTRSALRLDRRNDLASDHRRQLASAFRERLSERAGTGRVVREKGAGDPILRLRGLGKEVWAGVDPDRYVEQLREARPKRKPAGRAQR